jgi:hypothetical protein
MFVSGRPVLMFVSKARSLPGTGKVPHAGRPLPIFVERKVGYSALFTNLVGAGAGAVSFPLSDVILVLGLFPERAFHRKGCSPKGLFTECPY